MSDATPPTSPDSAMGAPAEADEILRGWLDHLTAKHEARPPAVVDAYRELGGALLAHGLRSGPRDGLRDDVDAADVPLLDHVLDRVVAVSRRAGLSIADVVDDIEYIVPVTADRLARGEGEADSLTTTTRVVLAVGNVVRRLVRLLEQSAARAQRERGEDLAAMTDMLSHELKNRLGAARTASQMLLSPDVYLGEQGIARAARLVESSVVAALRTVDDVRDLAVGRTLPGEETRRSVGLPKLLRGVVERLRSDAERVGVRIEIVGDVVARPVDASRVRLIVFNLLLNGVKYSDPAAEERWVRVRTDLRDDGRLEIRVEDNGVGIPDEELEDVFLYRVRGSDAGAVPGSGLGLAIVKESVDQLGASITVESVVGEGTTFTIVLDPLEEAGSAA